MSKQRKTVSLDPEVKAYLDANGRNASETVNRLVQMEMGEEVVNEQLIKMRMDMEKDRYEDAAQKARGHLERYNQLSQRLEQQREKTEEKLQEARETLQAGQFYPENPAVENWADKLDMTPEELIEELEGGSNE
jgi:hypothetical protein